MYTPRPVPEEASPALRTFLEEELNEIAADLAQQGSDADLTSSRAFFMADD